MPSSLMSVSARFHQIRWSLRYRGVAMTALSCLAGVFSLCGRDWYWKYKERHFDRRHGLDTGGLIPVEHLDVDRQDRARGWGYMATQPEWFHAVLDQLHVPFEDYSFIDLGSGKGRTLLLAAARPFKSVVGVEYSAGLHAIAQRNLQTWRGTRQRCHDLRSVLADAGQFELPPTPSVLYLYNPFKEEVMRHVLANLEVSLQTNPRHIVLIYANPTCKALLDEARFLTLVSFRDGDPAIAVYEAGSFNPKPQATVVFESRDTQRPSPAA